MLGNINLRGLISPILDVLLVDKQVTWQEAAKLKAKHQYLMEAQLIETTNEDLLRVDEDIGDDESVYSIVSITAQDFIDLADQLPQEESSSENEDDDEITSQDNNRYFAQAPQFNSIFVALNMSCLQNICKICAANLEEPVIFPDKTKRTKDEPSPLATDVPLLALEDKVRSLINQLEMTKVRLDILEAQLEALKPSPNNKKDKSIKIIDYLSE
jgi:hypothetical protein